MSFKDKLKRAIRSATGTVEILGELSEIRMEIGQLRNKLNGTAEDDHEFKVFSQFGDDGIIQWLISNLNISEKIFVEFGVENYIESNTRFLLKNNNWSGLVMDGDSANIDFIKQDGIYWRHNLKAKQAFITAENINDLLSEEFGGTKEKPKKIGLLSIDIDGNDYWVWKAIDCVDPDIIVCEYNGRWGKERAVTIPYNPGFIRGEAHYSMIYWGASLAALVHLANIRGYCLVAGNKAGNNAYFVKKDLLNAQVKEIPVDDAYYQYQFRESRNESGELSFLNKQQELELLNSLEVVDVSGDS